jgi:drug/metabolite transporter (DMT)-like permease
MSVGRLAEGAQRRALALLLLCHVNGAGVLVLLKFTPVGPVTTAFWRLLLALPLLVRPGTMLPPRREWGVVLACGLLFGLDLAFWYRALQQTSLVNATLLINLYPALVALLAWPMLKQRPTRRFWLGFAVTLAGGIVIVGQPALLPTGAMGDAQAVAAAFVYSLYFVFVARLSATYGAATALLWTNAAAVPWLAGLALLFGETITLPMGWAMWPVVAISLSSILGQWLFTYAMARLPAALAALTSHLGAPLAALAGWLAWGQPVGWHHLIGGGAIILGLSLAKGQSVKAE